MQGRLGLATIIQPVSPRAGNAGDFSDHPEFVLFIECFELEETSKIIQLQLPDIGKDTFH